MLKRPYGFECEPKVIKPIRSVEENILNNLDCLSNFKAPSGYILAKYLS